MGRNRPGKAVREATRQAAITDKAAAWRQAEIDRRAAQLEAARRAAIEAAKQRR